jgi:lipopolysaccharide transport system ATP-binding protein
MLTQPTNPDMTSAPPAIRLQGVSFSYPTRRTLRPERAEKFWALKDLNLDIPEGSILGVVGDNGAGKSTLLALLAGILAPDTGTVLYRQGLRTTLLSLQTGFNPQLTGRENIRISGLLLGMSPEQLRERMEPIIALADIGDFIDQPLRTYSTGMKARVGFATAYHTDPDVMLLDEVFSVGDLAFSKKARVLMEEKIQSDKTVVMVSHGEHILKQLCQNLVWIQHGTVMAQGPTEEVWAEYHSTYLAKHS